MPPPKDDQAYLADMCTYARDVVRAVQDVDFSAYLRDDNLRLSIERRIEIIGEAARNVSDEFRAAHPEIPWRSVIGQRHVLANAYGEIDHERIWRLAIEGYPN